MKVAELRRRRIRRRRVVTAAVAVLAVALFLLRALVGDYSIAFVDAIRILAGADLGTANFVFLHTKLPRALVGLLAGAGLGAAGAAFQSMLRNPLASPDVIGVTLGSSAAAVGTTVFLGFTSLQATGAAFVGGLAVAVTIFVLSGSAHSASNRIILIGIGLAAALQAVIHWSLMKGNTYHARDAMMWLAGSLNAVTWQGVVRVSLAVVAGLTALLVLARQLGAVEAGDDLAGGLGIKVRQLRLGIMVAVVVIVAGVTSVAGPLAFIGLLSGPIARRLNQGRASLLIAALVGAVIVLGADFAGSILLPVGPLPAGVITGALGAPMLGVLLMGTSRKERVHG